MRFLPPRTAFPIAFALLPSLTQAQTTIDPSFEPATTLDTVQVVAGPESAQNERQNAATGKIIVSRKDLEKMDAATIGEILRKLPGVSLAAESEGGRRGSGRAPRKHDHAAGRHRTFSAG